ncbi:MAG: hypothetical protein ACEB74_05500 [Desulfovibrio aminophilus]|jgi:hypothetical protein|uniref:hypothetical protein n=1 Tax=Desulfovibrio aminophilus TaxID=81425 RepID=UPI0003F502A4|nr:hypothetical protein [Desulfovibrio aminophilus]MDY0306987.1 hypothetical protein [Desulfovibrionaceae bacterium]
MSESYIERALLKIARQINAYDEASLMDLWEKYAEKVRRFEPTKRWEESALLFGIIQGMRLKNQLFNYNWAQSRKPEPVGDIDLAALTVPSRTPVGDVPPTAAKEPGETPEKSSRTGKVLKLQPKKK